MNDNKISFIVYGVCFSILPAVYLISAIVTRTSPPVLSFYSLIIVAVMCFCFSYLAPNFSRNDKVEKQSIVKKAIITGISALVIAILIVASITFLSNFDIHWGHTIMILLTILVSSGFISAVLYTKKALIQPKY